MIYTGICLISGHMRVIDYKYSFILPHDLYTIGSFSNDDRDGNVNVKKAKHNFARAAHMFLYISFNDVTARLRRENA